MDIYMRNEKVYKLKQSVSRARTWGGCKIESKEVEERDNTFKIINHKNFSVLTVVVTEMQNQCCQIFGFSREVRNT